MPPLSPDQPQPDFLLIGAQKAGYAMVMFPMVALVLSVAFEGLEITPLLIVGVLLVLAGNFFVIKRSDERST